MTAGQPFPVSHARDPCEGETVYLVEAVTGQNVAEA